MSIIRTKVLEKFFGRLQVLRGIILDVTDGEKLVIIGRSGAGKSTLLRCINYLEEPPSGRLKWMDAALRPVKKQTSRELRNRSGWSFRTSTCSLT